MTQKHYTPEKLADVAAGFRTVFPTDTVRKCKIERARLAKNPLPFVLERMDEVIEYLERQQS